MLSSLAHGACLCEQGSKVLHSREMDPLDREKPWGRLAQITLITLVIGVIYLFFRWAVVVPEWGWRLLLAATAMGTLLYFLLANRGGPVTDEAGHQRRSTLRAALSVMVVAALTLPIWVVLYLLWTGEKLP